MNIDTNTIATMTEANEEGGSIRGGHHIQEQPAQVSPGRSGTGGVVPGSGVDGR